MSFLLALITITVAAPPLKHEPVVVLHGPSIRVEDVLDLRDIDPVRQQRIRGLIIARLPQGVTTITLSNQAIAGLVRRSVPRLQPFAVGGGMTFVDRSPAKPRVACSMLRRSVVKGAVLSPQDLAPSDCVSADSAGLQFEPRSKVVRASRDLDTGEKLGRLTVQPPPEVEAGRELTMVSRAGPVRIERRVTALQAGRNGRRLFVRDHDGNVASVTFDGATGIEGR